MSQKPTTTLKRRKDRAARVQVAVRLPAEIVKRIDGDRERRDVPVSRNHWLLEAAVEKLNGNGSGAPRGKE